MRQPVSFDEEPLILVDSRGQPLGSRSKLACHLGDGMLHKAFSVFVFNSDQQVLLQQRSADKMLWPAFWSNSCCSHPRLDEQETAAVHRRLAEELGITVHRLEKHFDFEYQARYQDIGSEWEYCAVFTAHSDQPVSINPDEVSAIRWVAMDALAGLLQAEAERFTPWIKLEWQRLLPVLRDRLAAPDRNHKQ